MRIAIIHWYSSKKNMVGHIFCWTYSKSTNHLSLFFPEKKDFLPPCETGKREKPRNCPELRKLFFSFIFFWTTARRLSSDSPKILLPQFENSRNHTIRPHSLAIYHIYLIQEHGLSENTPIRYFTYWNMCWIDILCSDLYIFSAHVK